MNEARVGGVDAGEPALGEEALGLKEIMLGLVGGPLVYRGARLEPVSDFQCPYVVWMVW